MYIAFAKTLACASGKVRALCLAALTVSLAGCWGGPSAVQPERIATVDPQLPPADSTEGIWISEYNQALKDHRWHAAKIYRDSYITARMYAIDIAYTNFESRLTEDNAGIEFGLGATNVALTTASTLVPVAQTKTLLSGLAGGVHDVDGVYSSKVLLAKTIQNIQTQMRADRHKRRAVILANIKCEVKDYPLGMAMSNLEALYRAGTLSSGLIGVSATVSKDEEAARQSSDASNPGPTPAKMAPAVVQQVANQVQKVVPAGPKSLCGS